MKLPSKTWWSEKIPGGGFISDLTGAIETNLAKASRFILFVDLAYAGARTVLQHTANAGAHAAASSSGNSMLDAIWLVSQILAFDLSSPGLERIAREAEAKGDKWTAGKTRATKWAGIVLGSLTFVEMGLIQLNWIPEYLPAFSFTLMVLRGIASVLVLNFTGIDAHTPVIENLPAPAQQSGISPDDFQKAIEQLKGELAQQIASGLQQIKSDVLSHVHITEEKASGQSNPLLSAPGGKQADIPTNEQRTLPERTADTETAKDADTEQQTTTTGVNKLDLTVRFMREHPNHAKEADFESQLAAHLGLKRPASARFWLLKAQELLKAESDQQAAATSEQGAYNRLLAYVQAHQPTTQKEVALALGITDRSVRRHLTSMRKSGQLPQEWMIAYSGQESDSKAEMSASESLSNEKRNDPMSAIESDQEADRKADNRFLKVVK